MNTPMLQTYDFFEALFGTATNELGMTSELYAFLSFFLAAGFYGALFASFLNLIGAITAHMKKEIYLGSCVRTLITAGVFYVISVVLHMPLNPVLPFSL